MTEKDKKVAAVDALQRLFHLLAGQNAAVVLAQDDVDRNAEPGQVVDALRSYDQDDDKQRAKAQRYLVAES